MHLERGPEFYQKHFFKTCIMPPHWEGFDKIKVTRSISYMSLIFATEMHFCTLSGC